MLRGDTPKVARLCAELFARLMAELERLTVPPPLPNPYWLRCDHAGAGLWPPMGILDERDQSVIPDRVVETLSRATSRLMTADLP